MIKEGRKYSEKRIINYRLKIDNLLANPDKISKEEWKKILQEHLTQIGHWMNSTFRFAASILMSSFFMPAGMTTIENFLDMQINYYARTNFSGITNIIDALGGITVESDYSFETLHGNYQIKKGKNEMDGDMALCFVRERYALPNGDFDRGKNQQKVLKAMMDKAMSPKIITNFNNILSAIEGSFETDMSSNEIKSLINMQLNDMAD